MSAKNLPKQLWCHRELIRFLVYGDFKSIYKTKTFGFIWSVLDPLLMMGVYFLLVSVIFKRGGPYFPLLLFCALLFWKCFTSSLSDSVTSISGRAQLIKAINFPKVVLPFSKVLLNFLELGFGLLVIIPFLFLFRVNITWNILWLPFLLLVQFLFTFGLALSFSLTGVYFRDFQNILQYFLRIWFYLSPVLYSAGERFPKSLKPLYMLNPFSSLLESYKNIFVWGRGISAFVLWAVFVSMAALFIGIKMFRHYEEKIAKDV
ncbi:MAG: ABC transporter permease [Candidatus Omnitrophica bacterium]|nr:ABC transporter permease [Candidatus Omnitrophota bacterium]